MYQWGQHFPSTLYLLVSMLSFGWLSKLISFCSFVVRDVMGILSLAVREQNEILSLTVRDAMR